MVKTETSLERGALLIRRLAANLPDAPGVYRMVHKSGEPLYIGKARSLRKRVASYARTDRLPVRLQRMIALTDDMVFVHTHTEAEALLLESNLIKKFEPRFNILLKDDKSFPYIHLANGHDFPLLTKHRGARKGTGDFFGPFASARAVNRTLIALQKAFMLRNCSDSVFSQRTRPCLQYHIKRCTAPCVGLVSREEYAEQIDAARSFLAGKSREVQDRLVGEMEKASSEMRYEEAARLRDRIMALTDIQSRQDINVQELGDADIIALYRKGGQSSIQVFFFRAGQNFGNRAYFPKHSAENSDEDILSSFIAQFYSNKIPPRHIYVNARVIDRKLIEEALSSREDGGYVKIFRPQRGTKRRLMDFVTDNARQALERESLKLNSEKKILDSLANTLSLSQAPERIEVYDNSHISGDLMVGAMIVAGPEGLAKKAYRKFNIRSAQAADDYGMMREVMHRRFSQVRKEGKGPGDADWPDLLIIDGGLGQFNAVQQVLEEIGITELTVLSISKGPDRQPGKEKLFLAGRPPFRLRENDPVFHYLQRLRDEAHRFAIGAHRTRRTMKISRSLLDDVPGIGPSRKKALLHHFGSAKAVSQAGVGDLEKVEGISAAMAIKIYEYFHDEIKGQ